MAAKILGCGKHLFSVDITSTNKMLKSLAMLQCATRRKKSFSISHPIMTADYQHLSESKLPTYHFQDSLPRLPLPKLTDTTRRYVRALEPLLDAEALAYTKKCVNAFLKCEGNALQGNLEAEHMKNKHTNFISGPWFNMYLSDRKPLPINYNPCLVFNHAEDKYQSQSVRTSNLIISSLRFYRSLNEELLEPEVYHMNPAKSDTPFFRSFTRMLPRSISWYGAYLLKAYPLDMSQYKHLFNTTRIPQLDKDYIKHSPGKKHIVVMRKGHFYTFDVLDKDGNIVPPDHVLDGVRKILAKDEKPADFPVGVLTTEKRDVWGIMRQHLESLGNTEVLELIDSALFTVCLDDVELDDSHHDLTVRNFLHADGSNRWFDKSFTIIVTKDGTAGLNFEHSWGDGVAVLRYFNDIQQDSINKPRIHFNTLITVDTPVRKLEFNLDDRVKAAIVQARHNYKQTCDSLHVGVVDFQGFGRNLAKPLNISPDAIMQLAFQLAYEQLEGKQVATYESCSTAAFKHGRTETVRPCSLETKKLCKALMVKHPRPLQDKLNKKEFRSMLIDCSKYHSQLVKEAAMGQGFDRHLFALQLKEAEFGFELDLFKDPAYKMLNHNILSTSTLASENLQLGAFGPVVPDGYGIGYTMWPERLGCVVTSYAGKSDLQGFLKAIPDSLEKIWRILDDN